jgi:hypothetical protein
LRGEFDREATGFIEVKRVGEMAVWHVIGNAAIRW